ncbi:MAG: helicase associated domain-containing protein [Mycobacterium sp.]
MWEEGFSRLSHYVERTGDARIPRSYLVDGYKLGAWVAKQRDFYAKGTLDSDRQNRLQDLPGWTWEPYADRWEGGVQSTLALRRTPR